MLYKKVPYKKLIGAISEISQAISSDKYLDDILRLIVTVTANVMDSKICSLWLLRAGGVRPIVEPQSRRQFVAARKRFREWLERWPKADAALREEADERSAENCFLGIEQIHAGGPPENRIDIELMGDGYLLTQQDTFRKHAEDQLKEFWREPLYDEYASYLNVWRFDLASRDEGVDEVARPEMPRDVPDARKARKRSRPLKEYSTALNCQAAGPQNQVWADPDVPVEEVPEAGIS